MPGFTGDLDVDLERGLAECASKTIMTHILEEGFHGQRKMIKVHIQAVAETAQVASKEEMCWLAIAAATAWLPTPEHTMTTSLAADMATAGERHQRHGMEDLDLGTAVSKVYGVPRVNPRSPRVR